MKRFFYSTSALSLAAAIVMAAPSASLANDKLVELAKDPQNWVMTGRDYNANNYSKSTEINK